MRCLWIACGMAFAMLALSAAFRPPTSPDVPQRAEPIAQRQLADEDVAQILALRAELGSPASQFADGEGQAAFEQELRQIAGLDESAFAGQNHVLSRSESQHSPSGDNPRGSLIDNDRAAQAQ